MSETHDRPLYHGIRKSVDDPYYFRYEMKYPGINLPNEKKETWAALSSDVIPSMMSSEELEAYKQKHPTKMPRFKE